MDKSIKNLSCTIIELQKEIFGEKNLTKVAIVGITHIDSESQEKVSRILKEVKPDAVCLELDDYRLQTLLENEFINNGSFLQEELNNKTELFDDQDSVNDDEGSSLTYTEEFTAVLEDIGFFESELARIAQTDNPGKEMLIAYKIAKEMGSEIYLIDRSINEISKVLEEEVSSEEAEKFQELVDELVLDRKIVAQPMDVFGKESNNNKDPMKSLEDMSENEEINLNEVLEIFKDPEALDSILSVFNQNFPMLYSILLEDRNVYMSKQILKVLRNHTSVVIILGYGHVSKVAKLLKEFGKDLEIEIMN